MTAPLCLSCGFLHAPAMDCEEARRIIALHDGLEMPQNTGKHPDNSDMRTNEGVESVENVAPRKKKDREAYNAYMRDYMAKRRARLKNGDSDG